MRQIVLDTETTGLETADGHRIIEIGAVEMINRKQTDHNFHVYLNPQREIDEGASSVHGLTYMDLKDKPLFVDIVEDFMEFIRDAEVIIHNAPFDVDFINNELTLCNFKTKKIESVCRITDSLKIARTIHPGQRNNLDALCKRYNIDNSTRLLHGALLDAEILADVYLTMTGGQTTFLDELNANKPNANNLAYTASQPVNSEHLVVIKANQAEIQAHENWLNFLDENSQFGSLWRKL